MKKILVFYLITCLFIGLLSNQVMAQKKLDNNSIYNIAEYNNDKFEYYKKIMNGDIWNNYLKRDSSFAYVNFKNNQEDNIALKIATNITRDVTLVDVLLPGFDGDNAKVEYYEIALSSLLVTLEDNLSADINKQSGADSIKSDIDILLEGGMALSGLLSEFSSDLALALNSGGYNTVSEAFKLSNVQLNSMDIIINDFSQYIELDKYSAIYVKYHNLLKIIINQSNDELLVRAAKNISEISDYCYKYRLDNFSSLMKDVAKLESGHFFDVIDAVIKDNSTTSKELLGGMNILNNVTTLYGSLNLGVESGVFIGDALVGGSNIILRNYEMCAMALVRESIINEIEENNRKISSPNDIQSIDYVMDLLISLLYVNVRGEYCCYSLLSEDARLLSLVNYNVNGEKNDDYYKRFASITYDCKAILDGGPNIEDYIIDNSTYLKYYVDLIQNNDLIALSENSSSTDLYLTLFDINFDNIPELFFYNGEYNSITSETINVYGIENDKAAFLFSDAIPLDDIKLCKSKINNDQFYFCHNGKMGWLHDYRIECEGLIPMYHYNIDEDKYYLGHVGEINFFSNEITHKEYNKYFQNLDVTSVNVIRQYFSAESSKDEIIMQLEKANEVFIQGIQLVDGNEDKVTIANLESGAAVLTYTPNKGKPRKIKYIMDDVTFYGSILYHDINENGIDEIIVNLSYVGSTYGATDVYIYSIVNDELVELLNMTQDNISNYNKDFYACTGASSIENNLIVSICTYSNTEPVDYCLLYTDDKWEFVNY